MLLLSRAAGQISPPVCQFFQTFSYSERWIFGSSSLDRRGVAWRWYARRCKPDLFSLENCNRERHHRMPRIWSAVVTAVIGLLGDRLLLPTRLCVISCCCGRNNMDACKCADRSWWHRRADGQMAANSSTNTEPSTKSTNAYLIK